jgi:hypothetical protein
LQNKNNDFTNNTTTNNNMNELERKIKSQKDWDETLYGIIYNNLIEKSSTFSTNKKKK